MAETVDNNTNGGSIIPNNVDLETIYQDHEQLHQQAGDTPLNINELEQKGLQDFSCIRCYPTKDMTSPVSAEFQNFWKGWFNPIYSPKYYTRRTIDLFETARKEGDHVAFTRLISFVVMSIKYKKLPYEGLQGAVPAIINTWDKTNGFQDMRPLEEGNSWASSAAGFHPSTELTSLESTSQNITSAGNTVKTETSLDDDDDPTRSGETLVIPRGDSSDSQNNSPPKNQKANDLSSANNLISFSESTSTRE